jgi:AcrR family transcriptional regulator
VTDILDSSQAAVPSAPAAQHDPGGRPLLSPPQAGLRERKKARTRASLREHALRLFREKGYQNTTVEQIAAAAEVSPSTFFRYFPTKEDLVLQDDMDVRMIEALEQQPPDLGPVAAVRAASRQMFDSYTAADMDILHETIRLTITVPEIRARAMDEFARTITVVAEAVAKRAGRSPDDLAVRAAAGAVVGVIMSVTMPWEGWTERTSIEDTFGRIDEALGLLEAGLPL